MACLESRSLAASSWSPEVLSSLKRLKASLRIEILNEWRDLARRGRGEVLEGSRRSDETRRYLAFIVESATRHRLSYKLGMTEHFSFG